MARQQEDTITLVPRPLPPGPGVGWPVLIDSAIGDPFLDIFLLRWRGDFRGCGWGSPRGWAHLAAGEPGP